MAIARKELETEVTQQVEKKVEKAANDLGPLKGFYAKIPVAMHEAFNRKAAYEDSNVRNTSEALRKLIQKYLDGEIDLG